MQKKQKGAFVKSLFIAVSCHQKRNVEIQIDILPTKYDHIVAAINDFTDEIIVVNKDAFRLRRMYTEQLRQTARFADKVNAATEFEKYLETISDCPELSTMALYCLFSIVKDAYAFNNHNGNFKLMFPDVKGIPHYANLLSSVRRADYDTLIEPILSYIDRYYQWAKDNF